MKISAYSFGSITVDDKVYRSDLIVFPDKIKPNWWRKGGHTLLIEDLEEVISYKPQVLIVGTGAYGVMEIPESTKKILNEKDIKLIDGISGEAYKIFNEHIKEGKKAVGAFHLTC